MKRKKKMSINIFKMHLRSIKQVKNLVGKRVLVRVDFDVAVKNGKVDEKEMTRIKAALPTINFLRKKGAKIILLTHIGRPEGKWVRSLSTKPFVKILENLLKTKVNFADDVIGNRVVSEMEKIGNGQILLLENVRFYPGEENNSEDFSRSLSKLADIYVNDAFATSHRAHASMVGVTDFLPSYAGFSLADQINHLSKILVNPKKPFVLIMGGGKISTKIPIIKNLLPIADCLLVAGGLATTIWKSKGYGVGASLVEAKEIEHAKKISHNKKIIMPLDVIVADSNRKIIKIAQVKSKPSIICDKQFSIVDIGPQTTKLFSSYISKGMTLVWNGPLGVIESPVFAKGTRIIGRVFIKRSAGRPYGVLGGGDTLSSLADISGIKKIDFISTGGGAMLEYLGGKTLPAIKSLLKNKN